CERVDRHRRPSHKASIAQQVRLHRRHLCGCGDTRRSPENPAASSRRYAMKSLRIAIAGLGTVGGGTLALLTRNAALLTARCGASLEVVAVSARDRKRDRGVTLQGVAWYDDAVKMAREADADVVVELIGGSDGVAKSVIEAA